MRLQHSRVSCARCLPARPTCCKGRVRSGHRWTWGASSRWPSRSRATTTVVHRALQGAATGSAGSCATFFTMVRGPSGSSTPCASAIPPTAHAAPHRGRGVRHQLVRQLLRGPEPGWRGRLRAGVRGNPLVNAMAVGLVTKRGIFRARAEGVGTRCSTWGPRTGRDGIHGATISLLTFDETAESGGRPCRWAIRHRKSCCSRPARHGHRRPSSGSRTWGRPDWPVPMHGDAGALEPWHGDRGLPVPQRETGMTPYESCSRSRRSACSWWRSAAARRKSGVHSPKWELDAVEIGTVTATACCVCASTGGRGGGAGEAGRRGPGVREADRAARMAGSLEAFLTARCRSRPMPRRRS